MSTTARREAHIRCSRSVVLFRRRTPGTDHQAPVADQTDDGGQHEALAPVGQPFGIHARLNSCRLIDDTSVPATRRAERGPL